MTLMSVQHLKKKLQRNVDSHVACMFREDDQPDRITCIVGFRYTLTERSVKDLNKYVCTL